MNFQKYLNDTFRITTKYPLQVVLGGLLVQLLNNVTVGLLAGPLYGGYLLMVIRYLRDGQEPSLNDIYSGLRRFGALFPFFVVMLLIYIGLFLLIIPALVFITWWIYTLPLMADRELRLGRAMQLSLERVNHRGFFLHILFSLVVFILPAILILNVLIPLHNSFYFLLILLPPLQAGCVSSLYLESFPPEEIIEREEKKDEQAPRRSPEPEEPPAAKPLPEEERFIPGE